MAKLAVESLPLFKDVGPVLSPPIPQGLSRSKRRTALALKALDLNRHPMTGLPLHPQAPEDASRKDRFPREFCCSTCVHLERINMGGYKTLDCELSTRNSGMRAWWPGCAVWKPIPEETNEAHDSLDHEPESDNDAGAVQSHR